MKKYFIFLFVVLCLASCQQKEQKPDGYGHFEADELFVSAELSGKIIAVFTQEGAAVNAGDTLAILDTTSQNLKLMGLQSQVKALRSKIPVIEAQREVLKSEISGLTIEFERIKRLKEQGAATIQQYEKMESQILTAEARLNTFPSQIQSLRMELGALDNQTLQIMDLLSKSFIKAGSSGVVLEKYVNAGEIAMPGKPLFKIATLSDLFLKAYVSGSQLASFSIGQELVVRIDAADGAYTELSGTVTWVSNEAEFTPKMIQTKEERVNLVYAMKVLVKNNGALKIGMPGEILLK